jgi:AraC family transcriptional regulator, transcriptional activator FtrA
VLEEQHVRRRPPTAARQVVAILATQNTSVVELTTPAEAFTTGRARGRYELRICAIEPGRVELAPGFSVEAPHGLDDLAGADTVIVPGGPDRPHDPPPALTRALRVAAVRRARIIASGSGTFVLAAAGLLDGRSATTRPDLADDLRQRFPQVRVDTSGPATADEGIHTCAGGAATLDTFAELVRQDHAPALTGDAARVGDDLAELLEWATARLDRPLSLTEMARAARVSSRTLARWFEAGLGTTPMQWLLSQRLRRARRLLETTSEPVERIARLTGFGSTSNFRLQFAKATGLSPQAYRRAGESARPALSLSRGAGEQVGDLGRGDGRTREPRQPNKGEVAHQLAHVRVGEHVRARRGEPLPQQPRADRVGEPLVQAGVLGQR